MKTANTILTTFLLSALAAAVPLRERDIVYVTATSEVIQTISTTTTITGPAATETAPEQTVVVDQSGKPVSSSSPEPTSAAAQHKAASSVVSSTVTVSSVSPSTASSEAAAAEPTTSSAPSSSEAAPSPSTTSAPSSSSEAPSSTSSSAAPSSTSSSGSGDGGECGSGSPCDGDLTYYTPGLGACGETNSDGDAIVALSSDFMGTVSNGNSYCGKKITLTKGGKSVQATVVDKCPGCSRHSVDTTTSVFQQLASLDDGRVPISWHFN